MTEVGVPNVAPVVLIEPAEVLVSLRWFGSAVWIWMGPWLSWMAHGKPLLSHRTTGLQTTNWRKAER